MRTGGIFFGTPISNANAGPGPMRMRASKSRNTRIIGCDCTPLLPVAVKDEDLNYLGKGPKVKLGRKAYIYHIDTSYCCVKANAQRI